ncbi:MarR family winged helix-turn-helix transcriptional regulator [Sphingomonas adhaesiva]|uniref:MarR family winged helix-turn-helix transcriptional regulator n=1 Tax=Sphingomonas adhaesiva TaxID=28212 RepID=UPI002FFCA610
MAIEDNGISLGALDTLVGYHIRRASSLMATDFTNAMAGTGIRQVLFGVLSIIAANPGINQSRIGEALGIQRANMVSLINELMAADFLTRKVSPDDRRAFVFELTAHGEHVVADALARIRQHEERLLSGFSAAERALLVEMLTRIEAVPLE